MDAQQFLESEILINELREIEKKHNYDETILLAIKDGKVKFVTGSCESPASVVLHHAIETALNKIADLITVTDFQNLKS